MTSWISIPFYLSKNTLKRWLEHPVSPLSKMLVPALLGFLAVMVLALFAGIEQELSRQLARSSIYQVVSTEMVYGDRTEEMIPLSAIEESMWIRRFPEAEIIQVKQPAVSARAGGNHNLPVLASGSSTRFFDLDEASADPGSPPSLLLLTSRPPAASKGMSVKYGNTIAFARMVPIPEWVRRDLGMEEVLLAPSYTVEPLLRRGFAMHTVARMRTTNEVRDYVTAAQAFYRAEGRQVKILSALPVLEELDRLRKTQNLVRTLIVMACGIILAMTLGSIAWLEYRQEAYLLALLRSFGNPAIMLFLHMLLENLLLVICGILTAWFAWLALRANASSWLGDSGFGQLETVSPAQTDFLIVLIAGIVGVFLAMLPIAIGLRRPPGLILQ
jgi:hypothetical protein